MSLRLGLIALVLACAPSESGATSRPLAVDHPAVVEADPLPAVAPITLADPDGQALTLSAVTARVAVEGPLSLTELELRFVNPQDRRIEGRFALTLPDGATISRFAKEVDGRLVEGEVVERQAAHRVYDTILQQMRDPALLEQDSGNRFSAKIFPIEPRAEVRVILSYTQVLRREDGVRAWSLPLRGLPEIGRFELHGRFAALPGETTADLPRAERSADGVQHLDMVRSAWTPDADVAVAWRADGRPGAARVLRSGDHYVATFTPDVPVVRTRAVTGPWSFYVDTSASAADGMAHRAEALAALLRALPGDTAVELRAFDQDIVLLAEGRAKDVAGKLTAKLAARGYAGGTDLGSVLSDAARMARPGTRVVLVTDGVATLGETNVAALAATALPDGVSLHALVLGAEQDGPALRALTAGRGRVVEVPFSDALTEDAAAAAVKLGLAPGRRYTVSDPHAAWVHAEGADDVRAGGEVVVFGRVESGRDPTPRLAPIGGGVVLSAEAALSAPGAAPLVEREAVRSHLAALALAEADAPSAEAAGALADEQVRLSVTHRVLCPKTTLLVLESEADYARFGLDRRGLADILTVGPEGLTTVQRPAPAPAPDREAVEQKRLEAKPEKSKNMKSAMKKDGADDAANEMQRLGYADGDVAEDEDVDADTLNAEVDAAPMEERESGGGESGAAAPSSGATRSAAPSAAAPRRSRSESRQQATQPDAVARPAPRGGGEAGDPAPSGRALSQPKAALPEWAHPPEIASSVMEALEAAVRADPQDRAAYNHLADALLVTGSWERLAGVARAWQPYDPDNPHVYEILGEAALGMGDTTLARRAFGSLTEIAGGKPEMLQRAGLLLWRAGDPESALVPLRRAVELRPDRANAWRHLALVLRASGRYAEAAELLEAASAAAFPDTYQGVQRVIAEELAAVYREWIIAAPVEAAAIRARAAAHHVDLARTDDLRVTLAWETDGNDVDLHVLDPAGEECFYSHKDNASGLSLYEDLTRGLGPEVIRGRGLPAGRYVVGVKYFSAGPMGVSRGLVVVEQAGSAPRLVPFRLVEGGGDMRYLTTVDLPTSPR